MKVNLYEFSTKGECFRKSEMVAKVAHFSGLCHYGE